MGDELFATFRLQAALLFVDISGFTNLCTRVDIDALQRHINTYFGSIIRLVHAFGGDVVRFAGDAVLCSWSVRDGSDALPLATRAACLCGLDIADKCARYEVPEADAQLSIHAGVGAGAISVFRVGNASRWEIFLAGDPLRQVAEAESASALGEVSCSPEAWAFVPDMFEAEERAMSTSGGLMWCLQSLVDGRDDLRVDSSMFGGSMLVAQEQLDNLLARKIVHAGTSEAYVHESVRAKIVAELDVARLGERRAVVTAFAMVDGLSDALASGRAGLEAVQRCIATALEIIQRRRGLLRQYILDDKGMVIIWTFGLAQVRDRE